MYVFSGDNFDINNCENYPFPIEEIAHALSMQCRFNGHTKEFYSVAQHSVIVANLLPKTLALHGLLHDAAEAYIGDMVRPLKQTMPDFRLIEERLMKAISNRYDLTWGPETEEDIKTMDNVALAAELSSFFSDSSTYTRGMLFPVGPKAAKEFFLYTYEAILHDQACQANT